MRFSALFASVGVLAGCAVAPTDGTSAAPGAPSPQSRPAPAPATASVPAPAPVTAPPPAPAPPVSPALQQQAHKMALTAVESLEAGNEDQAKTDLESALAVDPNSKLALSLKKQISVDPIEALGRDSFSYTVRSSDTLSRIAGRFLGDIFSFYILARYNDIKVPRLVAAGQVLKIPGKAPPPGSEREREREAPAPSPRQAAPTAAPVQPAPSPAPALPPPQPPAAPPAPAEPPAGVKAMQSAEAAEKAGDLDRALSEYNRAAGLDQPAAASKAAAVRRRMVANHTQAARSAMARQDLDGSIKSWDRVLAIDPSNDTARLERQRAITLRERLKGMNK
ncbi:MAG: LysM peptidoglycan-binding domain-containing protein [Ideonella sp.]